ncbi:hypothetical protein [Rhizobium rhizogenes]|uniref:hypothetical protein n=1 Tax=Rhizobium rhizogenes TaxID=359 RepID=UPI0022B68D7C|nr:hypothetical protein [Rhizobium rhizogenes]MCZ7448190.1 hypothetical protein [Rhizobium rhizogenes]MCZ7465851.1 hypothetical protein [Rhizobium rhizogenes]
MDPTLKYVLKSPMTWWSMTPPVVVFCITVFVKQAIDAPAFFDTISIALLALAFFLSILAAFFQVAPSSVTSREVKWANRNAAALYKIPITFEEVDFVPPLLTRVAAFSGGKRERLSVGQLRLLRV